MISLRSAPGVGLLLFWMGLAPSPAVAQLGRADPNVLGACDSIAAVLEKEGGFGNLVNPVLANRAQVESTAEGYRDMLSCLNSVPIATTSLDWSRNLRYHLRLFLSFAEPDRISARNSSLELVDLETSQDPAVRRLIEEVGLAPPEGLVLVRYFQSREQMPENIRRAFENPQTQAVTMSSRYVAVLTSSRGFIEGRIGNDALAATFSHELVHAFLSARLNPELSPVGFPRWFHEAVAIHYSDGGRAHTSIDPVTGGLLTTELTVQYEQYERVFRYLESELGPDRFSREVRRSVEDVDPSVLYAALELPSYEELVIDAELWWRWWPVPLVFIRGPNAWLLGGLMVALATGVFAAWRRWQPAVPGSALEVGVDSDLIESVKMGDVEGMGYMLRSGANPEASDEAGWSALAWAVWVNNARAVELLLNSGAGVTYEVRTLVESRDCAPEIVSAIADAMMREDEDSVEMDRG